MINDKLLFKKRIFNQFNGTKIVMTVAKEDSLKCDLIYQSTGSSTESYRNAE
jgi:hypothetical protein